MSTPSCDLRPRCVAMQLSARKTVWQQRLLLHLIGAFAAQLSMCQDPRVRRTSRCDLSTSQLLPFLVSTQHELSKMACPRRNDLRRSAAATYVAGACALSSAGSSKSVEEAYENLMLV